MAETTNIACVYVLSVLTHIFDMTTAAFSPISALCDTYVWSSTESQASSKFKAREIKC